MNRRTTPYSWPAPNQVAAELHVTTVGKRSEMRTLTEASQK